MHDIALIKSRINCVEYAGRIGLSISRSGDRCISPLRTGADNKSAFVVHTEYWYDFVEGKGGDVIDLSAFVNHNGDRGLAIQELARITGVTSARDYANWKQHTQRRISTIQGWYEDLRPQDREYLHSRRISDETIDRLRIGYTGIGASVQVRGEPVQGFARNRICIPYYKNEYVVSWIARAATDDQQPKYLKPPTDEMTEYEPWGLHTLSRGDEALYIAEGCFDALCLDQEGFSVLSSMGGYFGKETLRKVLSIAKGYKRVVLTFDNDEAGQKFTLDFGSILFQNRVPFSVAEIPHKYTDIADFYADGGEIGGLKMQDGKLHLAESAKDAKSFKQFAYKAARLMDRADLAEIFTKIAQKGTFGSAWLREVRSACYKMPPETIIIREILEKHKLLYVPAIGFYEYMPSGKWHLHNNEVINGYIANALGGFAAGGKLAPIRTLMQPKVLTTQQFDRKPLISFVNGTLELETGVFREHSAEDYCSVQIQYPYLPEADAPQWQKFIKEITAEDTKRQENLQFLTGYTLFNDCRYEKIFVLTGEGSNGKTVFTRILKQLFGAENVTHITPQGITEAFERIHLHASLINIAGEIRSDLTSTEELLKQISSGETIQACYKGRDFVQFEPRAKLVFACNGQLRSSDTTDGMARRLCIIDFPCKFVDFPDEADPLQYKKDVMLYDKLLDELPGIFNWAHRGYKDLLKYKGFTETNEHQQLMKAFRQASNPVEVFVEGWLDNPPIEILRNEIYREYRNWCEGNGHKSLSSTRFYTEFERCTRRKYVPFERSVRTATGPRKERGFERVEIAEIGFAEMPCADTLFLAQRPEQLEWKNTEN